MIKNILAGPVSCVKIQRVLALFLNVPLVALAILTNDSMMGTSVSTPTVVANAAPLCSPKRLIATATASSKKLDAPIIPAGAAMS